MLARKQQFVYQRSVVARENLLQSQRIQLMAYAATVQVYAVVRLFLVAGSQLLKFADVSGFQLRLQVVRRK